MKAIKKSICIIIALVSIFALNACEKKEKTYPPATPMELNTIYADFQKNELNAKDTHIGQRYKITAEVYEITENNVKVSTDIVYPGSTGSFAVTLEYEGQLDFVKTLENGNIVTFEGTLTDIWNGNFIDFEDVIFISKI